MWICPSGCILIKYPYYIYDNISPLHVIHMYIYICVCVHVHCDQWLKQLAYLIDQFWLGLQWLARLIRIYMCTYIYSHPGENRICRFNKPSPKSEYYKKHLENVRWIIWVCLNDWLYLITVEENKALAHITPQVDWDYKIQLQHTATMIFRIHGHHFCEQPWVGI